MRSQIDRASKETLIKFIQYTNAMKDIIYKLTPEQADDIINIGNQTGFHWTPADYGFGVCINKPPEDTNHEVYRNYITDNGLIPVQVDIHWEQNGVFSFTEINKINDAVNLYDARVQEAKTGVVENTIDILLNKKDLTLDEVSACVPFYPEWKVGIVVNKNEIYQHISVLYKVIQAHTTQVDWPPNLVPALFVQVNAPDIIPVWVQPTGAHDAYQTGDKVHFPTVGDPVYRSKIDANVWSPTAYPQGWALV